MNKIEKIKLLIKFKSKYKKVFIFGDDINLLIIKNE